MKKFRSRWDKYLSTIPTETDLTTLEAHKTGFYYGALSLIGLLDRFNLNEVDELKREFEACVSDADVWELLIEVYKTEILTSITDNKR